MEQQVLVIPDKMDLPLAFDLFDQQMESGPEATRIYPYYKNLAEGRLTTTSCPQCGRIHFPPRVICPGCLHDALTYVDIQKEGSIFAFTWWQAGIPSIFAGISPLYIAIAGFGPVKIAGRLYGADESIRIGDPVQWSVEEIRGPGEKRRYFPCLVVKK